MQEGEVKGPRNCLLKLGVLYEWFRAPLKGLGLMSGSFGLDPCKTYMAVSITWGSFLGRPYKSPTIWRSMLEPLIFGNSQVERYCGIREPKPCQIQLYNDLTGPAGVRIQGRCVGLTPLKNLI